ncbi:MAG: hypothetical protein EXR77_12420 [Myxococcales bacterium]|nr:hypothetical protein [Myxococcales bacterium]
MQFVHTFQRLVIGVGTLAVLTNAVPVAAAPPESTAICSQPHDLDPWQLLRRLSLDLRGRLPAFEDYEKLTATVNAATSAGKPIDTAALLADLAANLAQGEEFALAMRRYHEGLFWPSLAGIPVDDPYQRLGGCGPAWCINDVGRKGNWRKGGGQYVCGNWEQKDWDAKGLPIATMTGIDPITGSPYQQEGWVLVEPYWAPGTQLKVCAFDAQAGPGLNGKCATVEGRSDPSCGCGPNLRHCSTSVVAADIVAALREQLLRSVDDVTAGGKPYSDLLLSYDVWTHGRLQFWKKWLTPTVGLQYGYNVQGQGDPALPAAPEYTDTDWQLAKRTGAHAGVLSMPAFSLRFQTNRARANRFRILFSSQWFVPPEGKDLPQETGCDPNTDDLTQRCQCRGCHQVLEPLAARFGPIAEVGSTLMTDNTMFPKVNAACWPMVKAPFSAAFCGRFYVLNKYAFNPGWLKTWQYATMDDPLHQSIQQGLEQGPRGLAQQVVDDGQFYNSSVRNLWQFLMGRDMVLEADDPHSELALLFELSGQFSKHNDFRKLVLALVQLPHYRRVR